MRFKYGIYRQDERDQENEEAERIFSDEFQIEFWVKQTKFSKWSDKGDLIKNI